MALQGSASFYMEQRGTTESRSGAQPELQGSPSVHPLSNANVHYQANTIGSTLPEDPSSVISPHSVNLGAPSVVPSGGTVKRKRGRPRKYGLDGTVSLALTPSTATHPGMTTPTQNQGRGRAQGSGRKQQSTSLGEWLTASAGKDFTPHVMTIAIGEDIAMKIMSFAQQGPRGLCILSAIGAVSSVTLHQASPESIVRYEGWFEIICLSGSFLLTRDGEVHNRTGGLTVSVASHDGRVIGGSVGGMLIAATPVQVIVGSFLWGSSKLKHKKGEDDQGVKSSEQEVVDDQEVTACATPSQNFTPNSSSGMWSGSQLFSMHNPHVGIDLMHG